MKLPDEKPKKQRVKRLKSKSFAPVPEEMILETNGVLNPIKEELTSDGEDEDDQRASLSSSSSSSSFEFAETSSNES